MKPRMRGPKRASKLHKLFNLSKDDDIQALYSFYREKSAAKAQKIQEVSDSMWLCKRKARIADKKKRFAKAKSEAAGCRSFCIQAEGAENMKAEAASANPKLSCHQNPLFAVPLDSDFSSIFEQAERYEEMVGSSRKVTVGTENEELTVEGATSPFRCLQERDRSTPGVMEDHVFS
ncbi:hypothetical protein HPP92_005818 [Vanilla planifolia]|uniref:Uncharacterized protein n=1 Tax=Vanilla planifolia TaxID=51239 RepID=A0A835RQ93_VANPL|nr:hypothetical protein HPP92_005818 [Vanilla planifolia]